MADEEQSLIAFLREQGIRFLKKFAEAFFACLFGVLLHFLVTASLRAFHIPEDDPWGRQLTTFTDRLLMVGFGVLVLRLVLTEISENIVEAAKGVIRSITLIHRESKEEDDGPGD